MNEHPDYQYLISCGCSDVSNFLGKVKIPEPWALMLDADEMFYFGINRQTGQETGSTWDKWAVYRSAKSSIEVGSK